MMMSGYKTKDLIEEAQFRWLRPGEVLFILKNYEETQLNHEPPQKPPSGSLFLFNKRVLRFFRKDGHSWRRKKDGKNVGEAHERLKVGNLEALNCYYAHGHDNPNFQRRSYWMLDSAMEHIVLVHYRDITIGKHSAGPISTLTLGSSNIIQSSNSYTTATSSSEFDEEPYTTMSFSGAPTFTTSNALNDASPDLQINQALRRLEEQLSLDDFQDTGILYCHNQPPINDQTYTGSDDYVSLQYPDNDALDQLNTLTNSTTDYGRLHQYQQPPLIWKDILKYDGNAVENNLCPSDNNEVLLPQPERNTMEDQWKHHSGDTGTSNDSSIMLSQELEDSTFPAYTHPNTMFQSDADLYSTLFDQGQIGTPLASDSSLTIAQEQKFSIREISPQWGYATEPTKVLIIGTFTCDPSNSEWICMFGDTEVPVEIIQEGVICCHAPPHPSGKVTICITSGNREACSEVREFEYHDKPNTLMQTNLTESEPNRSSEELFWLVKFVQMLLSDKIGLNVKSTGTGILESSTAGEDSWDQIIETVLNGSMESWKTIDWLLEEVLKDKLQTWVWFKLQEDKEDSLPVLSKREQGIIHMVSGLGFVWALAPILKAGVGINFRDADGWTALHWAARFGREKMVAKLVAYGAYAGAVTDPSQQDPNGKTAASIASTYGHKGLAGYLSEVALTSHLSSLTLKESELSKCCADVEAERTVNSIDLVLVNEDGSLLKDAMAAVRNAAQAASRIQAAFRAHSFKKRKQAEAAAAASGNEYGISGSDIEGLSAASKAIFGNARDHNAALSIQSKYRGWKGRKDFLALRQKVVKIQAHVRGHQARKNYEIICWAVGIVEKVILRWHRKGVGLRGFHLDLIDEGEGEDVDVVKMFRKQKVDVALSEAVSRVVSMVNSTPARQQYRRMLEKYQQAKAERGGHLELEFN